MCCQRVRAAKALFAQCKLVRTRADKGFDKWAAQAPEGDVRLASHETSSTTASDIKAGLETRQSSNTAFSDFMIEFMNRSFDIRDGVCSIVLKERDATCRD